MELPDKCPRCGAARSLLTRDQDPTRNTVVYACRSQSQFVFGNVVNGPPSAMCTQRQLADAHKSIKAKDRLIKQMRPDSRSTVYPPCVVVGDDGPIMDLRDTDDVYQYEGQWYRVLGTRIIEHVRVSEISESEALR